VTAAPTPNPTPTLHAWANPITIAGIRFADHTWVTVYEAPSMCPPAPAYWYSWGGCHATGSGTTATALASHEADLPVARCICQPDVEDYLPSPGNPAHGGIDFYGITGVCHQLSNRILFATAAAGSTPLTVDGAHAYGVSRFVYGTYGTNVSEWVERKTRCTTPLPSPTVAPGTPVPMAMAIAPAATLDADLVAMLRERLGPEFSRAKMIRIRQIRASLLQKKAQLDGAVRRGTITPRQFADGVNELVNQHLRQAAQILTPAEYERLFGIPPGDATGIVDPTVAEQSNYRGRG
jgi:hypothetical protein